MTRTQAFSLGLRSVVPFWLGLVGWLFPLQSRWWRIMEAAIEALRDVGAIGDQWQDAGPRKKPVAVKAIAKNAGIRVS